MSGMKMKAGKTAGTGSAINVPLGFRPAFVVLFNATDGDVVDMLFASSTVDADKTTAATSPKIDTATAARSSNGLSLYAGSSTPGSEAAQGFTIGSAVSESAKDLYWVAFGAQ